MSAVSCIVCAVSCVEMEKESSVMLLGIDAPLPYRPKLNAARGSIHGIGVTCHLFRERSDDQR